MSLLSRPARRLLVSALALASAPVFAQSASFSQTVFIGDSLSDAGYFRPLLPAAVRPVTGQFTTNPGLVWAQWLADYYGTTAVANGNGQTGTDYAAGGARVGIDTFAALGPGIKIPVPSLTTQTGRYLASTGGVADPRALYSVWGGNNDLFAVAAGAPAQATIGSAVTAQIGIVGTLTAAGARYILVPSIPDIGLTPQFRAGGAAAAGQGTAISAAYNTALYTGLAGAGLRVIPVDTFHFLQEVVADPALYGYSNVTGTACQPQITASALTCNPTSYITPDAPNTYLFADGVHPSTSGQSAIFQLAQNMLEAPRQIALLPNSASTIGRARADLVAGHIAGKPDGDGMRWWSNLRGDFQRYGDGDSYDGTVPAITAGVDWTRGNLVYGAFAGYGRGTQDFGNNKGDFRQSDLSLGGFVGWYADRGAWVNGQISYSQLRYEVDRRVQIGPSTRTHSGSPGGRNITAAISAGWDFGDGALKQGPVLSVTSQQIDVDGYSESQPTLSTSLAYRDQSFDSLIGSVGWQFSYAASDSLVPYARATVDREFKSADAQVFARSQSIPGTLDYAVPGQSFDRSYGTVVLGARTRMMGFDANLGSSLTVGQRAGNNASIFATVGRSF